MREFVDKQLDLLCRGTEAIYSRQELGDRLRASAETGRPLRVKLGMDPSSPHLHLGHSVVLRKLRQFQDLGHRAVLIIGDYTARIGDPTGRNKTRPILTEDQIAANAQTYFQQAGKILDTAPDRLEIRRNSEWLAGLSFADVIRLTAKMTVAQMLERDMFAKRFAAGEPISIHELLYPLMQGHDSVVIRSDVELGGTDQTFNNLVGRRLQIDDGQPPQIVLIMPILVGADGVEKMSKSLGNDIPITAEPNDMFGRLMSIPDSLMENYCTLLTDRSAEGVGALLSGHPRLAKAELARDVVAQYHGAEAARSANAHFDSVIARGEQPEQMPEVPIGAERIAPLDLLVRCRFASSKSEARRLITQGGVSINGQRLVDPLAELSIADGDVLKVGNRRFARLRVEK